MANEWHFLQAYKREVGSWEEKFEVDKCSLWKHMHLRHFFTVIFQSSISGCFIWPAKWCDLRNLTNWTGILLLACGDRHRSVVMCIQFYFQQQRTNLLLIGLADKYLIILRFMIFCIEFSLIIVLSHIPVVLSKWVVILFVGNDWNAPDFLYILSRM